MTDQEEFDRICGIEPYKWKGKYRVSWCELCQTYSAWCEKCGGSNCNCMGCDECKKDIQEFCDFHPYPEYYMTKEERAVADKYRRLKKLIKTCFEENNSALDWDWLYYNGKFCDNDWDVFNLKYENYNTATKKYPEKFPYLKS